MENRNQRLAKLLTELNYSKNGFAIKIGVSQTAISNYINNDADLSLKVIEKICSKFSNISFNWLAYGEGEMFINGPTDPAGQVSIPVSPNGGQVSPWKDALVQQLKNENERLQSQVDRLFSLVENLSGASKSQLGKLLGNWKKQVGTSKKVSISVTPHLRQVA